MPFLRKRSPDGATITEAADIQLQFYYSFIDPKGMKGWIGLELLNIDFFDYNIVLGKLRFV